MALAYNLKFYGLGLLTLLAMIAVTLWIAVVSQTTTTAMGLGIGFYIFSLLYPLISEYLVHWLGFQLFSRIYFSSIPMIQWQGLVLMLGESPRYGGYIFTVIAAYTALFAGLAYRSFTRMDRWV
ncbi:ABC-2 family transporter protein [compost metagenome]